MPGSLRSNRHKILAKTTFPEMRRILFLVAHPVEDASRRYRVQQFVPLLERAGYACTISEFSTPQLFRALQSKGRLPTKALHTIYCSMRRLFRLADLSGFDLIVIHREVFPFLSPALEKWVLKQHKKVVFSLDDAIYTTHPDIARLNHPLLYRLKYGRKVHEVIRKSIHVIAGNRILAEYARQFNSQVTTIPTVVDCQKYPYKPAVDVRTQPLTIGWMGSRSTASYLFNIAAPLQRLAENYRERVQFRFFGGEELKLNIPNSVFSPFRLATEIDDLHAFDIGLMPMPDTAWTRGKCAFKAIQYMAMGIPTVASPVGATLDVIEHSHNGLLAESADEWYHALHRLVTDFDTRKRLSLRARQTIEEAYSLEIWGPKLVSLLHQLADPQSSGERPQSQWVSTEMATPAIQP
jgi:glycosyltransferase involved in cell wall biosynthesis